MAGELVAAWIGTGSFIPPRDIRELRDLTRRTLVGDGAAEKNRVQKILEDANVKIDDDTGGAQIENLAASSLLKFVELRKDAYGENWDVFYLRDKENREVDFVVTLNRRVHWLIEVKTSDDDVSRSLEYYKEKLQPKESLQLVLNLNRPLEKSGVKILPLAPWLESLPFGPQTVT